MQKDKNTTVLLIIDMQNDFCAPNGSLFVPGAPDDCRRLAQFIKKNQANIDDVCITCDSHSVYHIAHGIFWRDKNGNPPAPYTEISYKDFESGKYRPSVQSVTGIAKAYIKNLELAGQYTLCIWPQHCLKGSVGAVLENHVYQAVHDWESAKPGRCAMHVLKGDNPYTEHYSAIKAEVPHPDDPSTFLNLELLRTLQNFDTVFIAGEALSHCVAGTVRDLSEFVSPNSMVLLSDCTSPVKGFEEEGERFVQEMTEKGMRVIPASDVKL